MHPAAKTRQVRSPQSSQVDSHKKCAVDDTITATVINIPAKATTTDIALCSKPIYKFYISISFLSESLTPFECLLDTGTNIKQINASVIHKKWTNRSRNTNPPRLHTAATELIHLSRPVLLHLRSGDLPTRISFWKAFDLSASLWDRVTFLDEFICGIFPSKLKVASRHLRPASILVSFHTRNLSKIAPLFSENQPESFNTADAHS